MAGNVRENKYKYGNRPAQGKPQNRPQQRIVQKPGTQQSRPPQGSPQQRKPRQGRPPQASVQQRRPQQGRPQQGRPPQASVQQRRPQQGRPPQGSPQQRRPQQSRPPQGRTQQSRPPQGNPQQGKPQQGSLQSNKAQSNTMQYGSLQADDWQDISVEKRKKRIVLPLCITFLIIMLLALGYYGLPYFCVKKSITIEAGDELPSASAFLKWKNDNAVIVSGIDENTDTNHVQDLKVVLNLYHQNITTMLYIDDTVPPQMTTKDISIMLGDSFEPEDMVENVSDITDCGVVFKEKPQVENSGIYTITLIAEDEGGNICQSDVRLEIIEDTMAPVIEGVEEITITVGESVSYKRNVTITDDYDDKVKLEIDKSEADTDTPGDYTIIYSAMDRAGNRAEVSTILHVREANEIQADANSTPMTEEAVNAEADKILASITNSSMSQYEVIKAIYDWVYSKVAYADGAPKDSWVAGAYYGLVKRRGDCYTYAMTAKCLLNRAGITNMDIERIPVGNGMHFWNLVDIGEGWRHFDTCRRADGSTFFYLTDAELMAYSDTHTGTDYPDGTHHYDRSLYPEIP